MRDILFYGLSTVAATFGSAVGLVSAASIFRTQKLDQICGNILRRLVQNVADSHGEISGARKAGLCRLKRLASVHAWQTGRVDGAWGEASEGVAFDPATLEDNEHLLRLLRQIIGRIHYIQIQTRRLVLGTLAVIGCGFVGLGHVGEVDRAFTWTIRPPGGSPINVNAYLGMLLFCGLLLLVGYGKLIWSLTESVDFES